MFGKHFIWKNSSKRWECMKIVAPPLKINISSEHKAVVGDWPVSGHVNSSGCSIFAWKHSRDVIHSDITSNFFQFHFAVVQQCFLLCALKNRISLQNEAVVGHSSAAGLHSMKVYMNARRTLVQVLSALSRGSTCMHKEHTPCIAGNSLNPFRPLSKGNNDGCWSIVSSLNCEHWSR